MLKAGFPYARVQGKLGVVIPHFFSTVSFLSPHPPSLLLLSFASPGCIQCPPILFLHLAVAGLSYPSGSALLPPATGADISLGSLGPMQSSLKAASTSHPCSSISQGRASLLGKVLPLWDLPLLAVTAFSFCLSAHFLHRQHL